MFPPAPARFAKLVNKCLVNGRKISKKSIPMNTANFVPNILWYYKDGHITPVPQEVIKLIHKLPNDWVPEPASLSVSAKRAKKNSRRLYNAYRVIEGKPRRCIAFGKV